MKKSFPYLPYYFWRADKTLWVVSHTYNWEAE